MACAGAVRVTRASVEITGTTAAGKPFKRKLAYKPGESVLLAP